MRCLLSVSSDESAICYVLWVLWMTLVEGIGHNQRHGYRQRTEHLDVVFEILNRYADHNTSCTYWG